MSDALEVSAQKLAQALLNQSTALLAIIPTGRIFIQSTDVAPNPDNKDRIVCTSGPQRPDTYGISRAIVLVWMVPVTVTLSYSTQTAANVQACIGAINAAMQAAPLTAATAIITASGIRRMETTEEGQFETMGEVRTWSRTFNYLAEIA